jgi:hypothetical protein
VFRLLARITGEIQLMRRVGNHGALLISQLIQEERAPHFQATLSLSEDRSALKAQIPSDRLGAADRVSIFRRFP